MFSSADRLVILALLGGEASGRYFLTTQIMGVFRFLDDGLVKFWHSRYFKIAKIERLRLLRILLLVMTICISSIVAVLAVDNFTVGLLATGLTNYVGCICFIGIGMLFNAIFKLFAIRYVRDNQASALAVRTIFVGSINLLLCYLLVFQFGMIGAAAAFATASLLLLTLSVTKNICE